MPPTRAAVVALRESGASLSEIARKLDLAHATVTYHVHALDSLTDVDDPRAPTTKSIPPAVTPSRTRERVADLLADGKSRREIADELGVTRQTVTYHVHRLGGEVDVRCARRYDWDTIQAYYDQGHGARECARQFGFNMHSWHMAVKRGAICPRPVAMPLDVLLGAGTPRSRNHVKGRLLAEGLKDGCCEECGIGEWRDAPLTMSLHHVNGERHDNRLENLQLLCPNCHSQTENFAGRNRGARANGAA